MTLWPPKPSRASCWSRWSAPRSHGGVSARATTRKDGHDLLVRLGHVRRRRPDRLGRLHLRLEAPAHRRHRRAAGDVRRGWDRFCGCGPIQRRGLRPASHRPGDGRAAGDRGARGCRPRGWARRSGELSLSLLIAFGDILTAASGAASGARAATGFHFDPATTLVWAVPLTVLVPLLAFVLAATSALPRRSAANMAMFGAVVTLGLSLLVAWGMTRKTTPFQASYPYFNFPVAFTGPSNFQGFGIDIVLHVDRLTSVAILVVELCVIAGLAWHRVMGRSEPGGARFYALVSVLLFATNGALVSYDLAELLAFWGLAGAATYLMLSQRWGSDEASRSGRIALALPFASDLSFLCGIGVLYSRYGVQSITGLLPILHTTRGVGLKALTAASILLFVGVAGRLALWPLQSWLTSTARTSPPAASAIAQSVWSVVAIVVLLRIMPFIAAPNVQILRDIVYACGVAAVAAPLLALLGNDPRRAIVLIGSGVAAIGAGLVVHAYEISSFTYAMFGIACVLAAAPARAAATMAASSLAAAMRTDDMAEMGDGLRRVGDLVCRRHAYPVRPCHRRSRATGDDRRDTGLSRRRHGSASQTARVRAGSCARCAGGSAGLAVLARPRRSRDHRGDFVSHLDRLPRRAEAQGRVRGGGSRVGGRRRDRRRLDLDRICLRQGRRASSVGGSWSVARPDRVRRARRALSIHLCAGGRDHRSRERVDPAG